MLDQDLLFEVVSDFPRVLVETTDVSEMLDELVVRSAKVVGVAGAGVAVLESDTLAFGTALDESIVTIERVQEAAQRGPCIDAHLGGEPVVVADLAGFADRWPEVVAAATAVGVHAVAAIPMNVDGVAVGVLDLYDTEAREWSEENLRAARWLADMTTAYVVLISRLRSAERLAAQLQRALDSRVKVEQAKGVLAGRLDLDLEQSFAILRHHARSHNLRLIDVAESVVDGSLVPSSPDTAATDTAATTRSRLVRSRHPRSLRGG